MNTYEYDVSIDHLPFYVDGQTDRLSFIRDFAGSVINKSSTTLLDIPDLLEMLKESVPQLPGEELLLTLLCLFQSSAVLSKYGDDPLEIGLKTLTRALCTILPTFFQTDRKDSFHSLFGTLWWIKKLQMHIETYPKDLTHEYLLESWFLLLSNDIPKRASEGCFEKIEFPYGENSYSHPFSLTHNNTLQEWHALCYWLSQIICIDQASHQIIFNSYSTWAENLCTDKTTLPLIEGGLSYLIAFFEKKPSLTISGTFPTEKLPLSFIDDCDIHTWLELPLSRSLGLSLTLDLETQKIRVNTLMQKTIYLLTSTPISLPYCLEAVTDALCVNMNLKVTLLDICNLHRAISGRINEYSDNDLLQSRLIYCYARAIGWLSVLWTNSPKTDDYQNQEYVLQKVNLATSNNMFLEEIRRLYSNITSEHLKKVAFETIKQITGNVLPLSSVTAVVRVVDDIIYVGRKEDIQSLFYTNL